MCKSLETILFDLRVSQRHFALVSAYKPPSVNNATFTNELSRVLDAAFLLCENVVCIGDLNSDILHPLCNNKQGQCLLDINDIYDLDSWILVQMHFKKLCDTKPNNQRKFWSTIKPYINSRKCAQNNSRIILKENDKLITDSQAVTETLNKYFTSITRTDAGMTRPIANNSCINNYIGSVPTLSLKKTNYREVKDILVNVKENKATGADLIPPLKCYASR